MPAVPYSYFYDGQLRRYILQFLRVFSGLQVQYGVDRDSDGENDYKNVGVYWGEMDRVIANILKDNKTFTAATFPIVVGAMTSLDLRLEDRGPEMHQDNVTVDDGGTRRAIKRLMPVPYYMNLDLSIAASNAGEMFQVLEQILLLFTPKLTIEKSDNPYDFSYITEVELTGLGKETNYPMGTSARVVSYSLQFRIPVWLNFPHKDLDSGIIESIITNVKDFENTDVVHDSFTVDEDDL